MRLDDRAAAERAGSRGAAPRSSSDAAVPAPGPLFDNETSIGRYASCRDRPDGDRPREDDLGERGPTSEFVDLSVRRADGSEAAHFPAMQLHIGSNRRRTRPQVTMAFAVGDENAVAFKSSGASFYLRDWSSAPAKVGLPDGAARRIIATGAAVGTDEDNTLLPAQWPLIHPLFAVARTEHGWRAAWMVGNGMQAVETDADFDSDPGQDGKAHEILSDVLIGEPVGVRLAFSRGGRFLVLEQNVPDWQLVDVKIWDLGSTWRNA